MANTTNKKTAAAQGGKPKQQNSGSKAKQPSGKPKQSSANTQSSKAEKTNQVVSEAGKRQAAAIILFGTGLFTLFLVFVEGENVWNICHNFIFTVFGFCAYIIPLLLLYMCFIYAKEKPLGGAALNLVSAGGFIVFLSSVIHLGRMQADALINDTLASQIGDVWQARMNNGVREMNGGIIGAVIGGAIGKLFGKTGAIITVIILLIVALLFLTGITLPVVVSYIRKPVKAIGKSAGERFEQSAQRREELREQRAREEAEAAEREAQLEKEEKEERTKKPPVITDTVKTNSRPGVFTSGDIKIKTPSYDPGVEYEPLDEPAMPKIPLVTIPADAPKVPKGVDGNPDDIFVPVTENVAAPIEPVTEEKPAPKKRKKAVQPAPPVEAKPQEKINVEKEKTGEIAVTMNNGAYDFPSIECLELPPASSVSDSRDEMQRGAEMLVSTLESFKIKVEVSGIVRGPSVTRYELVPEAGIRISKITSLADDIALRLAAQSVRIEAPIPGKSAVGIEIPNDTKSMVSMREIIDTDVYRAGALKSKLSVALGKDITGNIITTDLTKMPHLLVAGTTGSGKSVCMNAMIISILYNASPDDVKMVMIDPKQVEFVIYNGIAHLEVPVVTEARKAAGALGWAVAEMEKRYRMFSENSVRDIRGFNKLCLSRDDLEKMHHIVIFIDELSDLMMAAPKEVEDSICRLAQMARAAGIHLVIATQSPRADILTGLIKANIPSRISLKVANSLESRIIIDMAGAEQLLGNGDLLFKPIGTNKPTRVQGCYISDEEVEAVVNHIKSQSVANYNDDVMKEIEAKAAATANAGKGSQDDGTDMDSLDPMFNQAVEVVLLAGQASTTMLQKKLKLGYARASRVMDELEDNGIVGPSEGAKPRQVLITKQEWYERIALADSGMSNKNQQLSFSDIERNSSSQPVYEEQEYEDEEYEDDEEYEEPEKAGEIISVDFASNTSDKVSEEEETEEEIVEEDGFADIYEDDDGEPQEVDITPEEPVAVEDFDEYDAPVNIDDIFADDADFAGDEDYFNS